MDHGVYPNSHPHTRNTQNPWRVCHCSKSSLPRRCFISHLPLSSPSIFFPPFLPSLSLSLSLSLTYSLGSWERKTQTWRLRSVWSSSARERALLEKSNFAVGCAHASPDSRAHCIMHVYLYVHIQRDTGACATSPRNARARAHTHTHTHTHTVIYMSSTMRTCVYIRRCAQTLKFEQCRAFWKERNKQPLTTARRQRWANRSSSFFILRLVCFRFLVCTRAGGGPSLYTRQTENHHVFISAPASEFHLRPPARERASGLVSVGMDAGNIRIIYRLTRSPVYVQMTYQCKLN